MSLGQAIAPHLPYLRRYGRAISGSQQSGDALVARLLETLVAHPDAVDIESDLRIQLYRMVHDNFGLVSERAAADESVTADIAIATRRGSGLADPLTVALNGLIRSGSYRQVLERWSLGAEAIDQSRTNPPGLPKS